MSDIKDVIIDVRKMKDELEELLSKKEHESTPKKIIEIFDKLELIDMNREVLKNTKIGVIMTNVKRSFCSLNNLIIVSRAEELIKKWKSSLATNNQQNNFEGNKLGNKNLSTDGNKKIYENKVDGNDKNIDNKDEKIKEEENIHKSYIGPLTGDNVRDRARVFLWKAMVTGVPYSQAKLMKESQVCEIAAEIESVLYREYIVKGENSTRDYNLQLKTIKWNLSDLKNPELNSKLYVGKITPEEIAKMQSKEMASDAKQKERERHKQESLEACQSDWDLRNLIQKEGQFTCGKCKTNKTTYYQMQTRSADEPMTTFVRCLNCGNRWKF